VPSARWQDEPVRIVALADTHAPRRWKSCPPLLAGCLRQADAILHAGDVCIAAVLDELAQYAPVHAVVGNNDGPDVAAWGALPTLQIELAGLRVAMIHDSGAATGRLRRMRAAFPDSELVVFGHSHIPLDERSGGFRIFNPGSPTDRRRQPHGTFGVLQIDSGAIADVRLLAVD
jgi:putative phosphoesterase